MKAIVRVTLWHSVYAEKVAIYLLNDGYKVWRDGNDLCYEGEEAVERREEFREVPGVKSIEPEHV